MCPCDWSSDVCSSDLPFAFVLSAAFISMICFRFANGTPKSSINANLVLSSSEKVTPYFAPIPSRVLLRISLPLMSKNTLLTFFILTATAKVPEALPVDMPSSVAQTKLPDTDLAIITIGKGADGMSRG